MMKAIISFGLGLCLGLTNLPAQSAGYFYPEQMVVQANALNLRDMPDMNGKKLATLNRGTVVQYLEAYHDNEYVQADTLNPNSPYGAWLKIRSGNQTGYAFSTYLTGTYVLEYENDFVESLPPMQWYGVYARDSFADELRRIVPRVEEQYNEMYGQKMKVLKTNQKETSKFIIGLLTPLTTGYCGGLGSLDMDMTYMTTFLGPGSQMGIFPGNDLKDTLIKPSYGLVATGCARLVDNYLQVNDYRLQLLDYSTEQVFRQDLTPWVKPAAPEITPNVQLLWFGDLDHDNKPDAIIQDCPYEVGCRSSLFLSSKAGPGERIHKVAEHFWPGD
ncbi:MAG: SH3 domain-containing protein [Saprospiraceae bacterium]